MERRPSNFKNKGKNQGLGAIGTCMTQMLTAADQVADALDAMSKGKAVETVDPDAGY